MVYQLISFDHTTTGITLRNRLMIEQARLPEFFYTLINTFPLLEELVVLSTCNRIEFYIWHNGQVRECTNAVLNKLAAQQTIDEQQLHNHCTVFTNISVVTRLIKTAAGFLSLIIGETQIFGQLKNAYAYALQAGMTGRHLNVLFQRGFCLAKEVRTESGISKDTISMASAVARLATHIFSPNVERTLLFIGAGEIVRVVANHVNTIFTRGRYVICNRSKHNATRLAQRVGAQIDSLESIPQRLQEADIIICGTGFSGTLITHQMVQQAYQVHKGKLQLYIDLSIPTNIDSRIQTLEDVYYYNVDSLSCVIAENIGRRQMIAEQFDNYVRDKVVHLNKRLPHYPRYKAIMECHESLFNTLETIPPAKQRAFLLHRISKLLHATDSLVEMARITNCLLDKGQSKP